MGRELLLHAVRQLVGVALAFSAAQLAARVGLVALRDGAALLQQRALGALPRAPDVDGELVAREGGDVGQAHERVSGVVHVAHDVGLVVQ